MLTARIMGIFTGELEEATAEWPERAKKILKTESTQLMHIESKQRMRRAMRGALAGANTLRPPIQ